MNASGSAARDRFYWGGVSKNSQRNNPTFGNPRLPYTTCFPTSTAMMMSWLKKETNSTDGSEYEKYVIDQTESLVGRPGIAELAARYWPWITKPTRYWWKVHELFINSEFDSNLRFYIPGVVDQWADDHPVEFREGSWNDFEDALDRGPVILGTKGLPGPRRPLGGHILLVVGRWSKDIHTVHDPFGEPPYNDAAKQQRVGRYTQPGELQEFSILGPNRARFIGVREDWFGRTQWHDSSRRSF